MFNKTNADLASLVNLTYDEVGQCRDYVAKLRAVIAKRFWKQTKYTPQDMAAAFGTSAAKLFKVSELTTEYLNDLAAAMGDPALEVADILPTGWTYTTNADGTVTLAAPPTPAEAVTTTKPAAAAATTAKPASPAAIPAATPTTTQTT